MSLHLPTPHGFGFARRQAGWVLLLALSLSSVACKKQRDEVAAGATTELGVTWPTAQGWVYALELEAKTEPKAGAGASMDLKGKVQVEALASGPMDAGRRWVAVRFSDLSSTQPGEGLTKVSDCLSQTSLVELERGEVRALYMKPQPDPLAKNLLLSVVAELAVPWKREPQQKEWEGGFRDATGAGTAKLSERPDGTLAKRIVGYTPQTVRGSGAGALSVQLAPMVKDSTSVVTLKSGGVDTVRHQEQLEMRVGKLEAGRTTSRLELKRVGEVTSFAGTLATARVGLVAIPLGAQVGAAVSTAERNEVLQGKYSFEEAVRQLQQVVESDVSLFYGSDDGDEKKQADLKTQHQEAFFALTAWVAQEPGDAKRLAKMIREGATGAPLLLNALVSAGSEAAQRESLELLERGGLSDHLQLRGMLSLTRLATPSASTIAFLRTRETDEKYRDLVLMGQGTYCRKLAEAGHTAAATELGDHLISLLKQVKDGRPPVALMRAIANSGYGPALPVVQPYLSSRDESTRGAAVEALRLMAGPDAERLILERLQQEKGRSGLEAALRAAKVRTPSEPLAAAAGKLALEGAEPAVRYAALELLGKWLTALPSLKSTIGKVAESDAEARIREEAKRLASR